MLALLLTLVLSAAPIYLDVAPGGKDSNDCTVAKPCKTVKGAIAHQPVGKAIVVRVRGREVVACDAAHNCRRILP